MPFEAIFVGLSHISENLVKSLVDLVICIVINPVYKRISSIDVLVNSRTFENGVKRLLCIRLNYVLFMLHQIDNSVKCSEVLKNLAHAFGLGIQSDKLSNGHS